MSSSAGRSSVHDDVDFALGGDMADPATFLRDAAEQAGARLPGATLAAAFELIRTA